MSFLRGREVHLSVILIIALLGVLSGWAIGCNIPMRPENNMPAFWGLLLNNVKVWRNGNFCRSSYLGCWCFIFGWI